MSTRPLHKGGREEANAWKPIESTRRERNEGKYSIFFLSQRKKKAYSFFRGEFPLRTLIKLASWTRIAVLSAKARLRLASAVENLLLSPRGGLFSRHPREMQLTLQRFRSLLLLCLIAVFVLFCFTWCQITRDNFQVLVVLIRNFRSAFHKQ